MKRLISLLLSAALPWAFGIAANTVTTVSQVSSGVKLTTDVDYTITDASTPFTTSGSVDIVNTEHAVVILKNIRPSEVIKNYLGYIYINGAPAKSDDNCQVKMYAQGAIILPYAKTMNPLTCFKEPNFEGDSYSAYSLGSNGGFMNTLVARTLNNQIRSFKLKRGYMVTFAVGTGGWGYSRCFIADQEDLEVNTLPSELNGKISSYRIFKWYNAQKKGLASNGGAAANAALKTSWCYDWAQGNASLQPDVEWVPNHIYEDWPSPATCGGVTGSCHMKTNNEPRNQSDDHPQDLATILGNWQNLMRTGMRLCSPSSWDGSDYWNGTGFIKQFLDSIDARGWRCDIVDAHCYWPEGNFGYLQSHWWPSMKRPIWISEWIWGASWNNNGCWGSGVTDNNILNTTKNILNTLNKSGVVERYAYWNSESKGHIYENNKLTALGEYYASMETGLGYNKNYEFIPKAVYKAPYGLSGSYNKTKQTMDLTWSDPNGDMMDSIVVECKLPGSTKWERRATVTAKDKSSASDVSYTYSETLSEPGIYYYHVVDYYNNGKKLTSGEASATLSAATAVGQLQYGEMKIANTDVITTDIAAQDVAPYVVTGMVSNKNTANGITNQVQTLAKTSFKFRLYPWQLKTPVSITTAETLNYLILPADAIYHLPGGMTLMSQKAGLVRGDEVQVVFPEAFPEDVTPVVVAQQNTSVATYAPVSVRVYDVTNTGFKVKLVRQEGTTGTFNTQNINYFAASPGQVSIGQGKMLTVGRDTETPVGGNARQTVVFRNTEGDSLFLQNPYIIAASQTDNYDKASIFRLHSLSSTTMGTYAASIRRQVDETSTSTTTNNAKTNGDYIGWFIISDDPESTGEEEPVITTAINSILGQQGFSVSVSDGAIYADGAGLRVYNANGTRVALGQRLPKGMYVVTDGRRSTKVMLK
ncbi:MAG: hypothetical protein IJ064_06515 [Bacteroidaceae bacterium]|nr:hypothetical protein [Bacteroidaceae bacterium]